MTRDHTAQPSSASALCTAREFHCGCLDRFEGDEKISANAPSSSRCTLRAQAARLLEDGSLDSVAAIAVACSIGLNKSSAGARFLGEPSSAFSNVHVSFLGIVTGGGGGGSGCMVNRTSTVSGSPSRSRPVLARRGGTCHETGRSCPRNHQAARMVLVFS